MPAQDDYNMLTELCERLGLEDDERENFLSSAMSRLGHKMRTMWEDDTESGGKGGGGDFFARGRSGQRRDVGKRASGGGFGMGGYN